MSYKRLSTEEEDEIRNLWRVAHKSYPEIHKLTGRSLDTISGVIIEYRRQDPDIDEVREAIHKMKESKLDVPQVLRVFSTLDDMEKLGVTIDHLPGCIALLKKYEHKEGGAPAALDAGFRIDALEKETGLDYTEIEARYKSFEQMNRAFSDLNGRKGKLESELEDLEELKLLKSELDANQIPLQDLRSFIPLHKELKKLNFTDSAVNILASELHKIGSTPEEGSKTLGGMLQEYGTTSAAIATRKNELATKQGEIKDAFIKVEGLQKKGNKATEDLNAAIGLRKEEEGKKLQLEKQNEKLDKMEEEKIEDLRLATAFKILLTNSGGLTAAQVSTLSNHITKAKEERENSRFFTSDQYLVAAVNLLANYNPQNC